MYTFLQNTFQSEHILNNYPAPILGKIYQSVYLSKSSSYQNLLATCHGEFGREIKYGANLFYIYFIIYSTKQLIHCWFCLYNLLKKKKKEVDKGYYLGKQHSKHIASHWLHKMALYFFKLGSLLGEILTCIAFLTHYLLAKNKQSNKSLL